MSVISNGVDERYIMAGVHNEKYPAQADCCRYDMAFTLKTGEVCLWSTKPNRLSGQEISECGGQSGTNLGLSHDRQWGYHTKDAAQETFLNE